MIDGNTYALNKHLEEEERLERAQARFDRDIYKMLKDMEGLYFEIVKLAENYDGYNLRDYAYECMNEVVGFRK
jgi:hypothetical protein